MADFDDATALTPLADGTYAWSVPDGWQQGRGAWGGLVVGALVRALTAVEPAPVRSVSVQMMAPAEVGDHRVTVSPLRRGRSMTTWLAHACAADGTAVASMTAVTGQARSAIGLGPDLSAEEPGAPLPPAADLPTVPFAPPVGPPFGQHLEFALVRGLPMSGDGPRIDGWVRLRDTPEASAPWLLGLVDSYWPAVLPALDHVPRIATVSFAANLLVDPATLDPARPLAYHSYVAAHADGFTSEHRQLRTDAGRLLVDNVQSIVVA